MTTAAGIESPLWASPIWGLRAAERILAVRLPHVLETVLELVAEVSPARQPTIALLTGDCPRSPLQVAGAHRAAVTSAELAQLASTLQIAEHRLLRAPLAGRERWLVAARVAPGSHVGSVLAVTVAPNQPEAADTVAALLRVAATTYAWSALDADPNRVGSSLVIAQERARITAELAEQHEAALSRILTPLRARERSDGAARAAAVDAAVEAVLAVRRVADSEREFVEESADDAFARLRDQLTALATGTTTRLEFAGPGAAEDLPAELAHTARAICRSVLAAMLEHGDPQRVRVSWRVVGNALSLELRDDGSGEDRELGLERRRVIERARAVGGRITVDATAGWGTTVRAELPLVPAAPGATTPTPLDTLNARERQVLAELALGRRNQQIADALTISPNTVKFHVTNILRKLDVATRGEAAALVRGQPPGGGPLRVPNGA